MAKSEATLTKELISMASCVSYLTEMACVLQKKPIIPKAVQAQMAPAAAELARLLEHFNQVRAQAAKCAEETVNALLQTALGKNIGDMVAGQVAAGLGGRRILQVTGVVKKVGIWLPELPSTSAIRALHFLLDPATVALGATVLKSTADLQKHQAHCSQLTFVEVPDAWSRSTMLIYSHPLGEPFSLS